MDEHTERQAEMLANRVRKRARHLRKWARREAVSCYRLYDRDIPEVPLIIDWYDGRLHIAERARDDAAGDDGQWLEAMARAAAAALEVDDGSVFVKRRQRQRGAEQYVRVASDLARFTVNEGGLRFWVNLSDYIDTGLFLDHRVTRAMVRDEAAGKRVLNLFAYTGTFTVYAAAGGAAETTTVDLSATYLAWARDNLALNGLADERHRLVRADATRVLAGEPGDVGRGYDLVVLDPPTFSNSKRMRGVLDVRRDHADLVRGALALTRPGGVVYFSTNARRFRLDAAALGGAAVDDITARTTPIDFDRRRAHRCWRITR